MHGWSRRDAMEGPKCQVTEYNAFTENQTSFWDRPSQVFNSCTQAFHAKCIQGLKIKSLVCSFRNLVEKKVFWWWHLNMHWLPKLLQIALCQVTNFFFELMRSFLDVVAAGMHDIGWPLNSPTPPSSTHCYIFEARFLPLKFFSSNCTTHIL